MPRTSTRFIVLHCSATRAKQPVTAADIKAWHKAQGWRDIGYHYVIRRDGKLEVGRRPDDSVGSHVAGWNSDTLGICLVGGLNNVTAKPENNFTPEQFGKLKILICDLLKKYSNATILGHRDLSPDLDRDGVVEAHEYLKACPCFDARAWARSEGLPAAPTRVRPRAVAAKRVAAKSRRKSNARKQH
jgi:N-acetyl-anhydromuramyl-L-alanine amidase AmpD